MCILFLYINPSSSGQGYDIILASNRDEFFNRPTKLADFWDDAPDCIGGIDLMPGRGSGTWLGLSKAGKIGILLNILQKDLDPQAKGRGYIVRDFIKGNVSSQEHLAMVQKDTKMVAYNQFNIILLEKRDNGKCCKVMLYDNVRGCDPEEIGPGFLAAGNSTIDQPWKKVEAGKKKFQSIVSENNSLSCKDQLMKELMALLNDETRNFPDPILEKQGAHYSTEVLEQRSAIYVKIPSMDYGTRTNTIILIDGQGNCTYLERTLKEPVNLEQPDYEERKYEFHLNK
ncbi:transport and Golgi organization 2 homolog [Lingula anatina]|uniref:Transport and Golgi organization 2 homolog n=1 Tax=Lingula anatina TaxID=7574 RepID=A0A1S3JXG9_LINAN|nr:transport and Golgi organization 2 homolog [Lingula anatina]XP_013414757.1 transport and Golgi organization 2 homolog [Lingula anatina]|eukprot:XP_013414756.1 transport and Golgi organization 2 homolog [Lingula anatina]